MREIAALGDLATDAAMSMAYNPSFSSINSPTQIPDLPPSSRITESQESSATETFCPQKRSSLTPLVHRKHDTTRQLFRNHFSARKE